MYTGRRDLELGATFYNDMYKDSDIESSTMFVNLNMRYFF
jgi:hypothetical protein